MLKGKGQQHSYTNTQIETTQCSLTNEQKRHSVATWWNIIQSRKTPEVCCSVNEPNERYQLQNSAEQLCAHVGTSQRASAGVWRGLVLAKRLQEVLVCVEGNVLLGER